MTLARRSPPAARALPVAAARRLASLALLALLAACSPGEPRPAAGDPSSGGAAAATLAPRAAVPRPGAAVATFAGGCFWCMEPPFEKLPGVREVVSGYTGGDERAPSYEDVSYGRTGHTEAVQVHYDPARIDYGQLLEVYWRSFDPTDGGGQFADRGPQYRAEIFVHDARQRELAEASKRALAASGRFDEPIVTPITDFESFWPAEAYHQDYYLKNPEHYESYRRGSGRAGFLERTWGDDLHVEITPPDPDSVPRWERPSDAELAARLTSLQYDVTRRDATEPPFRNAWWDEKRPGIYVDVISGEPLFSSEHKFASGTGWPSFWQPLVPENVTRHDDSSLGMTRTEVRSRHADSHLGHVFPDGPEPTGLRYCINSAALRFIPAEELEEQGYAEFAGRFDG